MSASVTNQDQNTQEVKQFKKHTQSTILIGQHKTFRKLSAVTIPSPHYRHFFFREKVFVWV